MRKTLAALAAVAGLAGASAAQAHHSFAMFDSTKTVTVQGVVKDWQWTNPHSWISLAVTGPDGAVTVWAIEGQSPNILARQGWSPTSFKVGDKITIALHPLKSGTIGGSLVTLTLADGKVLGRGPGA